MFNKPSNTRGGTSFVTRTVLPRHLPFQEVTNAVKPSQESENLEGLQFPSNPRFSMSVDSAKGLTNKPGENNCFMNSPVQILWHLDTFRKNFRLLTAHACTGDYCVFCSLKYIHTNYQLSDRPILPSNMLRESLAVTFSNQHKFQLGSMDDASECYETILECFHNHVAFSEDASNCTAPHCITHRKMSLNISEKIVCSCGATSNTMNFSQSVFYVSTTALVTLLHSEDDKKLTFPTKLKIARELGDIRKCPNNSCRKPARKVQAVTSCPEIITVGFVWDSEQADAGQIRTLIDSIELEIVLGELFHDSSGRTSPNFTNKYNLVGLLCYYMRHYCVFLFHPKQKIWFLYDDDCVTKLDERWESITEKCQKGNLQPLLLIYSSLKNSTPIDTSKAPKKTFIPSLNQITGQAEKFSSFGEPTKSEQVGTFKRHPSYLRALSRHLEDASIPKETNQPNSVQHKKAQQTGTSLYNASNNPTTAAMPPTRKTVRFRREVETITLEGETDVCYMNDFPGDRTVVSVPRMSLRCYSKNGIRKLSSSFDPVNIISKLKNAGHNVHGDSFTHKTKEFLRMSTIQEKRFEDDTEYDKSYINPHLVREVLLKTTPKFSSLSKAYMIKHYSTNDILVKPNKRYQTGSLNLQNTEEIFNHQLRSESRFLKPEDDSSQCSLDSSLAVFNDSTSSNESFTSYNVNSQQISRKEPPILNLPPLSSTILENLNINLPKHNNVHNSMTRLTTF